jgi:tetratricopeptide (TPR) repeat protein
VPAKHRLRLRRAADQFVAAIADSDDFDLAYYNFGVVTLALGEPEAAEAAFLSAISRNPNAPQGHYAVAQQRFTNNRLDPSVAAFCDRVIDLKPSRLGGAQACDLKALSHAVIATERGDAKLLASAGRDANRGAFQSALALLGAEFRRNDRKDASAQVIRRYEVVAGSCYSTVAYIHGIQAQIPGSALRVRFDRWLAVRAMRIAISIDAANPYLYRQLATLYQQLGRRGRAVEAILKAARMRGDDPEFWADASFLLAQWGEVDRAKEVAAGVLKQTARATDAQLQRVRDALALIGSDEAARVHDILRLRRLRAEVWVTRLDKLVARAEQYRKLGDGWREGFVMFVIAEVQQVQKHTDAAIETLAAAVRIMDRSYPGESNRLGMHAIRAEWLHLADRTSEALEEIDLARRLDPLSTWAGEKFARICMALEEWEEGARAWETLLAQEAANADRYIGVAWCLLCLASQESDPVSRKELHLRAEGRLRDAVDLAGPQERGRTHYMLGYALALRGAHEVSIPHLMVAKALAYVKPLTLDLLASSCLGANHYDDAAGHADELIRVVEELLSRGQARTEKLCQDGLNPSYPDELLASAYNAKAYAAAGKGVAFAESHDWVAKAKTHTAEIADPDAQLALRGAVWDTEGWVLVREGNVDEAIPLFQKALAIGATADRYWHLAVALDRKAVAISDPKMQLEAARRAVECCRQVIPLDLWNMFSADANELRARLESRIAAVDPMFSPSQSLLGVPTPGSAKS